MADLPVIPAVPPAPKIEPNKPKKRAQVRPVSTLPIGEFGITNSVLVREMVNPSPPTDDEFVDEIPLRVLGGIINSINRGEALETTRAEAIRLASNLPDKADLIASIIQSHEFDRLLENIKSRAYLESILHRATRRGDLSTTEALAFFRIISEQVEKGMTLLKKSNTAFDSITVIEKVDVTRQQAERTIHQKFEGTTAQGREIIRRACYAQLKAQEEERKEKEANAA